MYQEVVNFFYSKSKKLPIHGVVQICINAIDDDGSSLSYFIKSKDECLVYLVVFISSLEVVRFINFLFCIMDI